ncbi:hypothetical protein SKAU_G00168900 [Synaphobranchus kaupii]|uniref:Reverse transcriptase domain-containing protein n=1 Tax=Synaphobranchus kaupii TaxID=118154 RepID=A0A9Q1FKM0_SYNKA|nr:hypothetical protein SKAU_G00168900 [Synaphobranchus kaupii]
MLKLKKHLKERKSMRVKYDTDKLKSEDILKTFTITLRNRYQVLEDEEPVVDEEEEVERDSQVMEKAYIEVAEAVLGKPRKKKKPWISEESWGLVDQREDINKKILGTCSERVKKQLRAKYVEKNREVKRSIKADKRIWMDNIASEAEEAARSQHMKTLYGLTKTLCNERSRQSAAILDKNGNLEQSRQQIEKGTGRIQERQGTTDQVFILRNIIEQVNEWQATLYLNFIDFEKAFDSIHRESLWEIMKKYGIPEKIVRMVRLFYEDFQCAVEDQGETCGWFDIKTGVKQGCNMSGVLFLIVMDWVMRRTVCHGENGIRWKFTSKLDDLDFADDVVLLSSTKQQIQDKTSRMEEEAKRVGLKINL